MCGDVYLFCDVCNIPLLHDGKILVKSRLVIYLISLFLRQIFFLEWPLHSLQPRFDNTLSLLNSVVYLRYILCLG